MHCESKVVVVGVGIVVMGGGGLTFIVHTWKFQLEPSVTHRCPLMGPPSVTPRQCPVHEGSSKVHAEITHHERQQCHPGPRPFAMHDDVGQRPFQQRPKLEFVGEAVWGSVVVGAAVETGGFVVGDAAVVTAFVVMGMVVGSGAGLVVWRVVGTALVVIRVVVGVGVIVVGKRVVVGAIVVVVVVNASKSQTSYS